MNSKLLRYSSIILIKPSRDWKIDILFLRIDGKSEFIRQWIDDDDDPLHIILDKMQREIGIKPEVVSLDPILSVHNPEIVYYCGVIRPYYKIKKPKNFDETNWSDPRAQYNSLHRSEDKTALIQALKWVEKDNYSALFMTRNMMFLN